MARSTADHRFPLLTTWNLNGKPINWHSSVAPLLLLPNRFFCGYTLKIIQYAARQNQFYTGWWFLTILKNISQWEGLSHILWKIKFMFETIWNHHISNHSPRQLRPKEPVDSSLLIRRIANGLQRFPNFRLVKAQVGQILRTKRPKRIKKGWKSHQQRVELVKLTKIAGDFQVFSWA